MTTENSKAYDEVVNGSEKKLTWGKVAKYSAFVGLGVSAIIGGAMAGLMPDVGSYLAAEGSIAVPAILGGITSLAFAAKGAEAMFSQKSSDTWVASEKEANKTLSKEELAIKKEQVGEKILQAREKAKQNEATMDKAVALGTFVSLTM